MAIAPVCDRCNQELTEPGGLIFSAPRKTRVWLVAKYHVCVGCMDDLIAWLG